MVSSVATIYQPAGMNAALTLRGLSVSYGEKAVLTSVDATFPRGQMAAIIGPNGAGKSTLLKSALGVVSTLSGEALFFDQSLDQARARIAYVPQRASIDWDFPVSVIDVVLMGLYSRTGAFRFYTKADRKSAIEALEKVDMADFAKRQIGQLSGGQQQRVFLARALAQKAELYLLDEPLAGVDAPTETIIINVLRQLRNDGATVIVVHHDLETVPDYFDHVFLLNIRAIAEGPVDLIFNADTLRAAYGGKLATASAIIKSREATSLAD